jgi:RimJ/RimL family protein N-acetyltransferase
MERFGSVRTVCGVAGIRDLIEEDVPAIIRYWLASSPEFLDFMGVDRKRLGGEAEIGGRMRCAIRSGESEQQSLAFAVVLDDETVGYTLLNRYGENQSYSHWHIFAPELRGKGISTSLYPLRLKTYFDTAPIDRLTHQTRTRNIAVNRMLDKFVSVAETKQIQKPDGVAKPGEFHIRHVLRQDLPGILRRAAELGITIELA